MLSVGRIFSRLIVSCLLVGVTGGLALTWATWDFELIMRKAELRYGNLGPVAVRLLEWRDLLGSDLRMPELEKLRMVNLYFNRRLRFSDDSRIWGSETIGRHPLRRWSRVPQIAKTTHWPSTSACANWVCLPASCVSPT